MGACSTCSSGTKTAGCNSNGGCSSGGCNKLNVFDWLSNMDVPSAERFNIIEVRFKGGQKAFYRNSDQLELITGDAIVVEIKNGYHLGFISLQGELVRIQMKKKNVTKTDTLPKILRLATEADLEKYTETKSRELPTMLKGRQIISDLGLGMKLSDVEYQADNSKAVFYYSAEGRVDFRELIKRLAGEFRIRVEMKQISLRHEAGRLGGIGSCGRELCCSTWLTDFKNVNTSAARYQNLALNPAKLSGQCGRLKCCLNFELESYIEALADIPTIKRSIKTKKGEAFLQKTDIFKKMMWFGFKNDNNWHPLPVKRVHEIMAMNKEGKEPFNLTENEEEVVDVLNSDLVSLDKKYGQSGTRKKKKKGPRKNQNKNPTKKLNSNTDARPKSEGSAQTKAKKKRFRPRKPPSQDGQRSGGNNGGNTSGSKSGNKDS